MLERIRSHHKLQLLLGLLMGVVFGFALQRGGVTRYDVLMGQLLLHDWTVAKIMLTAILVGMLGVYAMRAMGLVRLQTKSGSVGSTAVGGVIFGVGFAILGYCPGTMAGAAAQGSLDALLGGVPGMLLGALFFATLYPHIKDSILKWGHFGETTFPEVWARQVGFSTRTTVLIFAAGILGLLIILGMATG